MGVWGILALIGAAVLLGGWAALHFGKVSRASSRPSITKTVKWGFLGLALLLGIGGVASAASDTSSTLNLSVPNWQFSTIQSAIDAAPVGANIHIQPGTYHETLFIGKKLQIYGSEDNGGVVLQPGPASDDVGIVNYEGDGEGWLQHVRLEGGHAGIVGLGGDSAAAILEINDVEVVGSGLGIVWDSPAQLTVQNSHILETVGDGCANDPTGPYAFGEFGVWFAAGIGMYIANANVHLSDVNIGNLDPGNDSSVGIYIRESDVKIDGGLIYGMNVAGIWTVDSNLSLDSTSLWANHSDPCTGRLGDGIAVLLGSAELNDVLTTYNERCGISSFGATFELTDNTFQSNTFAVCGENFLPSQLSPGLPAQEAHFDFLDFGGNHCVGKGGVEVVCQVTSPGLEPPAPLP